MSTITYSSGLGAAVAAAATDDAKAQAVITALGNSRRIQIFWDQNGGSDPSFSGVEVYNIGASGGLTVSNGKITGHGTVAGTTKAIAANLAQGTACLVISGNGEWLRGSIGLSGTKDFLLSGNPTANGGVSLKNLAILVPPVTLAVWDLPIPAVPVGSALATMGFENYGTNPDTNVPVTFGQTFQKGAFPAAGAAVSLKLGATTVPAQIDVKATHSDGSVRHAVISAVVPSIAASTTDTYNIVRANAVAAAPAVPGDFAGMDASVALTIAGTVYTAALSDGLTAASPKWLSGNVCSEWIVVVPLKTAGNVQHPLLHARFYVRAYKGQGKARIDVVVENTWVKPATNPGNNQQGFVGIGMAKCVYDVAVTVGGVQVFTEAAVPHYTYARWRKTFWWNTATPSVVWKHDLSVMLGSKVLPNYATDIVHDTTAIAARFATFNTKSKLMEVGLIEPYMPNTGGREDIALLPAWDVRALLSQHKDAIATSLGTADRAGAFGAHYRNFNTGEPVSIAEAPYFGLITGSAYDNRDPATGIIWDAPPATADGSPNSYETAHVPDPNYIPYVLTGDFYYMEALKFWGHMAIIARNAGYRGSKALIKDGQIRGQAWCLRTLGHTAHILPDADPQKVFFTNAVMDNIDWYNTNFTNASYAWKGLGILINPNTLGAVEYPDNYTETASPANEQRGIAPWQDDHFTSVTGRLVELGFNTALPLFNYKAQFVIKRLTSGPAFCYVMASRYAMIVRDKSANGGAMYTSIDQIYQNTVAPAYQTLACGSQAMADLIKSRMGTLEVIQPGQLFPDGGSDAQGCANVMQPSVAYAKSFNIPGGDNAWLVYSSAPSYRPANTNSQAQFTILPRN